MSSPFRRVAGVLRDSMPWCSAERRSPSSEHPVERCVLARQDIALRLLLAVTFLT